MGLFGFFKKRGEPAAEVAERIQVLVAQLGDPGWEVRLEACEALGRLGPQAGAAVPRLQELIDDEHGDVCLAAAAALSEIERAL